jgi:acyl-CoA synthetase (AMP-forming)/AMP-acid ligase II
MPAIPPRFNLARACLERQARDSSDKVALIVVTEASDIAGAERWTYAQLDYAVRSVAAGLLARGLKLGDRLVLQLPNNSDYALLFFGAIAAGLVPVPEV